MSAGGAQRAGGGRTPRLASDFTRNNLASIVALVALVLFVPRSVEGWVDLPRASFATGISRMLWLYWAIYCLVAGLAIPFALRGLRGEALARAVLRGDEREPVWLQRLLARPGWRAALIGGGTMTISLAVSFTSLMMMVTLLTLKALGRVSSGLTAVSVLAIVTAWVFLWTSHALHYAREDLRRGGLDFPGDEERTFGDYLYASLAGQVTFGTTDVTVTTSTMRRAFTVHALIAFVFNTVILALILSLLTG